MDLESALSSYVAPKQTIKWNVHSLDSIQMISGTPLEASLLRLVEGIVGQTQTFRSQHPKVCEVPFSSISKLQLTIHEAPDFQTNGYLVTMFGEPETILNR